jgi:hypothetical protein
MAITVIGKQARIAKAKMPNKIRIELVVSFMVHLLLCTRWTTTYQ